MVEKDECATYVEAVIEAEIRTPVATTQIVRMNWANRVDAFRQARQDYWVDFCLTPRANNIRACYPQYWGANRFKSIGEVFAIPPGESLYLCSDEQGSGTLKNTHVSLACQFNADLVADWFDSDVIWSASGLEKSLDISDPSIRGLLMRMRRETLNPGLASEAIIELLAQQLAIELGRYMVSKTIVPSVKGGLATWRLRMIDERIRDVSKTPSLSELAAMCDLSVRQLSRGFRESRGCSIGEHIERCRFEQAKQLLVSGTPIKNIAQAMGYSSASGFSNAFRRITGTPPGQFVKII